METLGNPFWVLLVYAAESHLICTVTFSFRALGVWHLPNCIWEMQSTSTITLKVVQVC